jgi:hypothetical protein
MAMLVSSIGCAFLPSASKPRLGIENGTTLVVSVFVNGARVAESQPGGPPEIPIAGLPPLPWTVEARTASGRLLTSMEVAEDQVSMTTRPDGGVSRRGAFGRVDLSCGRLTIYAGDVVPSGPAPLPNSGQPGDCVP